MLWKQNVLRARAVGPKPVNTGGQLLRCRYIRSLSKNLLIGHVTPGNPV